MTETFKATVERTGLLKVLGRVARVVEKRNTIPILGNIHVEVLQDEIRFRGTDLDIEVSDQVKAEVAAKGAITVPAQMLHDIVRKLPEGSQVVLEKPVDREVMTVKAGKSRFTLQTLPVSDFPSLSTGELTHSFSLPGKDLHRLIERSQFAISTEETRYYLNGIYLHNSGTHNARTLRAVATDGHRLAQVDIALPEGAAGMPNVIVPRKTVAEVVRLFGRDDDILVELSPTKIHFTAGNVSLTSKLIDGTFPDYSRVIPQNNEKILVVEKGIFAAAADRVATISSERGKAVKMMLSAGKIVLNVNNPDHGSATEEMDGQYASADLDIGFNSRYLHDILGEIEGDTVTVKLADPGSPTIFLGPGEDSPLYVLMPMRVA